MLTYMTDSRKGKRRKELGTIPLTFSFQNPPLWLGSCSQTIVICLQVILAQAAVYLARAPKSIEVYNAYSEAKKYVSGWEGPQPGVPLHIRNAPTKLMKDLGYGAGYKYNPAFDGPVDQTYLPPEVQGVDFFNFLVQK